MQSLHDFLCMHPIVSLHRSFPLPLEDFLVLEEYGYLAFGRFGGIGAVDGIHGHAEAVAPTDAVWYCF